MESMDCDQVVIAAVGTSALLKYLKVAPNA